MLLESNQNTHSGICVEKKTYKKNKMIYQISSYWRTLIGILLDYFDFLQLKLLLHFILNEKVGIY